MANMAVGNSVIFQIGKESIYGGTQAATVQERISSEGFKPTYTKTDEGVFTGGRGMAGKDTMSKQVDGTASFLARPDSLGIFLKGIFGKETVSPVDGSTGVYKHVFTAVGTNENDTLPSFTVKINRHIDKFAYTGVKFDELDLSASAGDYLKCDITTKGKEEVSNTTLDSLTSSPLRAFRFAQGNVYLANSDKEAADITDIKLAYKNNLIADVQTTNTGYFFQEPECGTREISLDLTLLYTALGESYRKNYYKTDDDLAVKLEFISETMAVDAVPYSLVVEIPHGQVSDSSANAGDSGKLTQSFTYNAVDNLTDELITATLINTTSEVY